MLMKFSICSSTLQKLNKVPNIDKKGPIQKCHPIESKNKGNTLNQDGPVWESNKKFHLFCLPADQNRQHCVCDLTNVLPSSTSFEWVDPFEGPTL
jgi:hypothetical protein